MSIPAHLQIAIDQIGKLHDGPDVPRMAAELAAAFPDDADYWHEAADDTPWCAIFVAWCLMKAGITVRAVIRHGVGPMHVDWWPDYGTSIPVSQRQLGDIAGYRSGGIHHVNLIADQEDCVGGNQTGPSGNPDSVTRHHYRTPDFVVRPPAPGAATMPTGPALELSNGRGSWYSQFSGKFKWVDTGDAPNSAALGCPDDAQGVSFYDHDTLGHWFEVTAPNGVTSIEQQTDIGPHPKTGRTIDISAAAAERFGYSPRNFPTDSTFSWRPIPDPEAVAKYVPKDQAVRYRDLRKEPTMVDDTQNLPPAIPTQSKSQDFLTNAALYFLQNPDAFKRIQAFMTFTRTGQMPTDAAPTHEPIPATAPPAVPVEPAKPKWGFGTGILGTIIAGVLHQQGVTAPPLGDGSTLMSFLSFAAPLALSAFGGGGGVAMVVAKMAPALFTFLTAVKK